MMSACTVFDGGPVNFAHCCAVVSISKCQAAVSGITNDVLCVCDISPVVHSRKCSLDQMATDPVQLPDQQGHVHAGTST